MSTQNKTKVNTDYIQVARDVFTLEAEALEQVKESLDENFSKAVELIAQCKGRVVVIGMGKSGHIGAKIAATLASTGTPSFFCHPAEMGHGDLGMLKAEDVAIGISFSGNTEELRKILSPIKRMDVPLIGITGNEKSSLAEFSDLVLKTPLDKEACPLDLAPTSSTTATLVMGDALAVALMKKRNFKPEDFAKSHPLGSLGKSLTIVKDVMREDNDLPKISASSKFSEILEEVNAKKLGLTTVLDSNQKLIGTITDGDIRRAQINFGKDIFDKSAKEIMSADPKTINQNEMAVSAIKVMDNYRISDVVVVDDENSLVGIIHLKDLLKAGLL